jgi:hypothetical protein
MFFGSRDVLIRDGDALRRPHAFSLELKVFFENEDDRLAFFQSHLI